MYYFRDCYFDQHLAFGVSSASLARRPRRPSRPVRGPAHGSLVDLVAPVFCIGATFAVGFIVLDVLGLAHLAQAPSFDWLLPYVELALSLAADMLAKIPVFLTG